MRNYEFVTRCVEAKTKDLEAMYDAAKPVSFTTMRKKCAGMVEIERLIGYAVGFERGLHLRNEPYVRFNKSTYRGQPCYYMTQSAIDYIWVLPGNSWQRCAVAYGVPVVANV